MFTIDQIRSCPQFFEEDGHRKLRKLSRKEAEVMTDEELFLYITAETYCHRPFASIEQLNWNTEAHRANGREATLDLFFQKTRKPSLNDMF